MLLAEEIGAHDMEIRQTQGVEALGQPGRERHGITVGHAIEAIERRDANTDTVGGPNRGNGFEDFEQKSGTVLDRTAIGSGAFV